MSGGERKGVEEWEGEGCGRAEVREKEVIEKIAPLSPLFIFQVYFRSGPDKRSPTK